MTSVKTPPILYLLAGMLALTLVSCGEKPAETPAATPTPAIISTPEPTPTSVPIPSLEPVDVGTALPPPGDYAPWQEAYARFLEDLRGEEAALTLWWEGLSQREREDPAVYEKIATRSDSYWLYDIDKNGIPELLIQYGNCEAMYWTYCYTYREGAVVCVGDFECGHTSLWSWPGENGMLQHFYGLEYKYTIENGKLEKRPHQFDIPEGYYEEKGLHWTEHPDPADFISGSQYISNHRILTDPDDPKSPALTLPIYDYETLSRPREGAMEETEVRSAIGKVLWEGQTFYCHSGDGWEIPKQKDICLTEYLQTDGNSYYGDNRALIVDAVAWADVNGDGQTDCILRLADSEGERTATRYTVFSAELDGIYAYSFWDWYDDFVIDSGRTVYLQTGDVWEQVSFYREQSYTFPALQDPVKGDSLAWEPFSP